MKRVIVSNSQQYEIIKLSDWYDPEGLDINDDGLVVESGSKTTCDAKLEMLYNEVLDDKSHDAESVFIQKYTPGEMLQLYYPRAIAKVQYIVKAK